MRGIKYYPERGIDKKITELQKKIETTVKLSGTDKEKWDCLKQNMHSDINFIVNKDMYGSCKDTIEKIKNGETVAEDYLYDPYKLYDLLCNYTFLRTGYKYCNQDLDEEVLDEFVENTVKKGANIEEVKMYVLSSLFFNIDSMIDDDYDMVKSKLDFSLKLSDLVEDLNRYSPYEEVFRSANNLDNLYLAGARGEKLKEAINDYYNKMNSFDVDMLSYISKCKMKNNLLSSIIEYKILPINKVENITTQKIFDNNQSEGERYTIFDKVIKDEYKENMFKIMQDKYKDDVYTNYGVIYNKSGIMTKRQLNDIMIAKEVSISCDRKKALHENTVEFER